MFLQMIVIGILNWEIIKKIALQKLLIDITINIKDIIDIEKCDCEFLFWKDNQQKIIYLYTHNMNYETIKLFIKHQCYN